MSGGARWRTLAPVALVAVVVAAALTGGGGAARGDVLPVDSTTTSPPGSTSSTTVDSSTTTSTIGSPVTTGTTTTTTTPAASGTTTTSTSSTTSTTMGGEGDGQEPTTPQTLPPGAADIINSVKRSPANSTAALLAALQPLVDAGLSEQQAAVIGFGRFPAGGLANFSDDWLMPRWSGEFHFHHGCDIFAAGGTPARSPADGVLKLDSDALGGISAYVTEPDGTYYYLTHLAGYAPGLVSGQQVKVGDVIAFVGNSGDAQGGATHIHFEVHPRGGEPVDPKPYLDGWVADALAAAPSVVAAYVHTAPGLTSAAAGRLVPGADLFAAPAVPARSQLLWASSASPAGGALQLAAAEATEAASSVDWVDEVRRQRLAALEWTRMDTAVRNVLTAVTPAPLRALTGLPASLSPGSS